MADAGEVMLGPIGREFFGAAQILFFVFLMGSHILTFSIMMNTITNHGTCTIVFAIIGFIISVICCLPRTLHKVSYLSIASFISITASIVITMVGVGIDKPEPHIDATVHNSLAKAFLSVTNIIFAYAGHVAFFSFISALPTPSQYTRSLFLLQGCDTGMYIITAIVIYRYAGADVASPALGSASTIVSKVAYGIAIPTIVVAGVINGHVAAKYVYVRKYRGTDRMSKRSWGSFGIWLVIVGVLWIVAWVIAEAIPVFNDLLGLISASFASWFTYGLSGVFWLYLNKGRYRESGRKMFLTALNFLIFCIGAAIVSFPPPFHLSLFR